MLDHELFARLFGYFSIGCWIVVFTPQFYENYKYKNTDGVSITFLTLWIFGDILNLFGVILEHLLFTMLLLALYYLFADCLLMGQVFYYRRGKDEKHIEEVVVATQYDGTETIRTTVSSSSSMERGGQRNAVDESTSLLLPTTSTSSLTVTSATKKKNNPNTRFIVRLFFVSSVILWVGLLGGSAVFFFGSGRKIDMDQLHLVPQLLGWGSAILYCASRIPQIMQNFRNESVEGLSLVMFIFSVVGNITYCVSIILESTDPTYLLINYPWLLGSGGTLFFDFTIFFQFYMYRKSHTQHISHK